MPDAPTIVCHVVRPMLTPISAHPGNVLTAWPGHPDYSLSVLTGDCEEVIRWTYRPEALLFQDLFDWWLDGTIRPASPIDEAELLRCA